MKVLVKHHVIFCDKQVAFRLSLIGFHKKVSITKIKIDSKDVECNIDEGLGWA
jgi:hypothetical protein